MIQRTSHDKTSMTAIFTNPNLFVFSGGPGCGKTTVLTELTKLGLPCVPEVARQIIQEQVASGGTALPWNDRAAYTDLMLRRSIDSYLAHACATQPTLFDRGIPDTLGYARLIGLRETAAIEHAIQTYRYAPVVFIPPPWEEIYSTDTERKQDFVEAERTFCVVSKAYEDCGYRVVLLPKTTPASRAQFILKTVKLTR